MKFKMFHAAFAIIAIAFLSACQTPTPVTDLDLAIDRTKEPDARYIEGTVVSMRSTTNTLIIAALDSSTRYEVKYDLHSRFFVNGVAASVVDIHQYMPAKIRGHMVYPQGMITDGTCYIDVAKFSAPVPTNVYATPKPVE